ncbi:Zinc finger, CCHC-type [Cucumis melo var. makuwa]|uniref:Zinc finger, CCHC-type n=1 Tax=Cucumis melo var. makuwa TaxID=1194695 RepID=A0A5A7UBJ8_CUCMM|nr:Zinc finger, CCHC-type [Cucumis melo var. makuwa]
MGHQSKDCRKQKNFQKKHVQAHITEVDEVSDGVADIDLCAVISECNMVGNSKEWSVDTGATRHICANKNMFTSYVSFLMENNYLWVTPLRQRSRDKEK